MDFDFIKEFIGKIENLLQYFIDLAQNVYHTFIDEEDKVDFNEGAHDPEDWKEI